MIDRIRTRAVWLAMGLALGTGAFAFAGATNVGSVEESPAVGSTEDADEVKPAKTKEPKENDVTTADANEDAGEHPVNHGLYVSQAAHCEDVEDAENEISFTAPEDCAENGKAHGEYVSSVAKSNAGKKAKGPDGGEESGEEGS